MALMSPMVNIKKLLDAQTTSINSNVDTKTTETKADIAAKATATQNVIVADGDITQAQLATITTVNGDISTDVQAINAHVTSENDRVLANIPSSSPIKSIQRGKTTYNSDGAITIAAVDVDKTVCSLLSASDYAVREVYLVNSTTIQVDADNAGYCSWEVIEYV